VELLSFDLETRFALWLFGAFAGGGLLGWIAGRFTRFEPALGVGLLVPGLVSAVFAVRFVQAWHELETSPTRTPGVVVAVEPRALGSGTTPVAVVEYAGPDGPRRAESGGGTSLAAGDRVVVIAGAAPPRVGVPREMLGGALAALLFATFPLSAAAFFLAHALPARAQPDARAGAPSRLTPSANALIVVGLLAGTLLGVAGWAAERALLLVFGLAALGLWLHVADGARRRGLRWTLGLGVLALNFSAWAFVLAVLASGRVG
jgi:hypothetical protein